MVGLSGEQVVPTVAGIAAEADPPTQKKQGEDDTCAKMATHRDECKYDASAQYERMLAPPTL